MTNVEKDYVGLFDFDLARAVLNQLVRTFDKMGIGPLKPDVLHEMVRAPGVYQLYHHGELVYVGKADNHLGKRLHDHYLTLRGRKNINVGDMTFRALALHPNWAPLTHESLLIKHYKKDQKCKWNTTGIGNHDPGRKREDWEPNAFDTDFPINEKFPCTTVKAGTYNGNILLQTVKTHLPFVFRYQTEGNSWKRGHIDYNNLTVDVPHDEMPADEMLKLIVGLLPGWQATVFLSHMILYKESKVYESGKVLT